MHAHLDLNHLYVKAPDFESRRHEFDYDARQPDKPTADGTVHVTRGSFTALGRRFLIDDAKIVETGATSPIRAGLKALYDNRRRK